MTTATVFTVPKLARMLSAAHGQRVSPWMIRRLMSAGKIRWQRIGIARCVQADDVGLVEEALGLIGEEANAPQ